MARKFLSFFFIIILCVGVKSNSFKLKQVLVLSRHNIRTPLTIGSKIQEITPQEWPKWPTDTGFLTPKGVLLEEYMGKYFSTWLNKEGLISGCPEEGTVNIYANTRQRTKQSAITFAKSAFGFCNVTVHYKNTTEMDPIFHPAIHNTSEAFKSIVMDEMNRKLMGLDLADAYLELENILEYKQSQDCIKNNKCSLVHDKNAIVYLIGEEPDVDGPFWVGNAAADAFVMGYYEGLPFKEIGWGKIEGTDQWDLITKFTRANQDVRFNMTYPAKDFAKPLIEYMSETFISKNETLFTLLMGHDSNLNTVMTALGFKSFELPGQFEKFPVGGRLVFQKFVDGNNEYYLKVEFIYLTWSDIRKGVASLNNPKRVILEINNCVIDKNGFCPWSDFLEILKEFV